MSFIRGAILALLLAAPCFADTPWLTSFTTGALRNDGPYAVGSSFTVGASALNATFLGRECFTGNSGTHNMYLQNSAGTILLTIPVPMSGCAAGTFVWAAITCTVLTAGATYYITSGEPNLGDMWSGTISSPIVTSAAAVGSAVFTSGFPPVGVPGGGGGQMFVPVNFQYASSCPSASTGPVRSLMGVGK